MSCIQNVGLSTHYADNEPISEWYVTGFLMSDTLMCEHHFNVTAGKSDFSWLLGSLQ